MKHFLREEESPRQEENFQKFLENFGGTRVVYLDKNLIKSKIETIRESIKLLEREVTQIMASESMFDYRNTSKASILNYLKYYKGCDSSDFKNKKTSGESFDDTVRVKLRAKNIAVEFLDAYDEYASAKKLLSTMEGLISGKYIDPTIHAVDDEGNELIAVTYNLNTIENRRVSTYAYNVIGLPKDHTDIQKAKAGITLFEGDLPQADLHNAFNMLLRTPESEEMFSKEDDKYKAIDKMIRKTRNEPFIEEVYQEQRQDKKAVTLGPIYGKRESANEVQRIHVEGVNNWLETIPKYQRFKKNILDKKRLGLMMVSTSYFGYTTIVEPSRHGSYEGDILNAALNSPIQTATSELIILITNSICQQLCDLGLVQNVDFGVYVVRYDEPIFWMKDEFIKDYSWVFYDHKDIIIDDWSVINLNFEATKQYHKYSEELQAKYMESVELHKDKLNTTLKSFTSTVDKFMPIGGVLTVAVGTNKVDNGVMYTLLTSENEIYVGMVEDEELITGELLNNILVSREKILDLGYDTVLIYSNSMENSYMENEGLTITVREMSNELTRKANHTAYVYSYLYDKKHNRDLTKYSEERLNSMPNVMTPVGTALRKFTIF